MKNSQKISIPYGAIKSIPEKFRKSDSDISIPYGAIKSEIPEIAFTSDK